MRSHIVSEQVKNNMNKFIESFDVEKFESKFGKIKEFLGVGVFGAVFSLDNGKVFLMVPNHPIYQLIYFPK